MIWAWVKRLFCIGISSFILPRKFYVCIPLTIGRITVHNHPYHGAGHTTDFAIVVPDFFQNRLVGFAGNTAQHVDIGAATPGLIIDVPDVYAEGMLFAGTRLYRKGAPNNAMWNYIRRNSRAAQQLVADIEARIASARLGAKRFAELLEKYGEATVFAGANQLMDYAERMARQRISDIPDGDYSAEGWLDDDGRNRDRQLKVKVTVRVRGDEVDVDLTGSADQTPTACNVPFEGSTKAAADAGFRKLLPDAATSDLRVPSNEGSFRPIKVTAPLGSIFNPRALAPVMPEKVIAGSSASVSFAAYSGVRPSGDYWVFLEVNEGAYGGRPRADGPDCIDNLTANTRNNPLEDLAMHILMICDRYELRDDMPPGAGEFRGGIGVVKAQRVLTPAFITHESERHTDAPWGIFGGQDGTVGRCTITNPNRPDEVRDMPSKFSGLAVGADDVMTCDSPNGGGYGNPLNRPSVKVLEDVLDGFCTAQAARDVYGVVVDVEAETVDMAATDRLRQTMGKA